MADERIELWEGVRKLVEGAESGVLHELVQVVVVKLMSAEVDGVYGAGYGERSPTA